MNSPTLVLPYLMTWTMWSAGKLDKHPPLCHKSSQIESRKRENWPQAPCFLSREGVHPLHTSSETWNLCSGEKWLSNVFHLCNLRCILNVKWVGRVTNTDVLNDIQDTQYIHPAPTVLSVLAWSYTFHARWEVPERPPVWRIGPQHKNMRLTSSSLPGCLQERFEGSRSGHAEMGGGFKGSPILETNTMKRREIETYSPRKSQWFFECTHCMCNGHSRCCTTITSSLDTDLWSFKTDECITIIIII